jgi:hypothetical protein
MQRTENTPTLTIFREYQYLGVNSIVKELCHIQMVKYIMKTDH